MENNSVSIFIDNIQSDELKAAAEALRALIFATIPQVEELYKYKVPFYAYRGRSICYLTPQKKQLVLGFVQGVQLCPRPGILVAEDRKQIRHLVFDKASDIDDDIVIEILQEAILIAEAQGALKKKKRK